MTKILSPAFFLAFVFLYAPAFAQPGLKKMQTLQERGTVKTTPDFTLQLSPKNQHLGSILFAPTTNIPISEAKTWLTEQFQLRPGLDELKIKSLPADLSDFQVVKLEQYFHGLRVEHGEISIAGNAGRMGLVQAEFYAIAADFSTAPALDRNSALQKAMQYAGAKIFNWENKDGNATTAAKPVGELVIIKYHSIVTDTVCLAYKFLIAGSEPMVNSYIYVNALNGALVLNNSNIREATQPAPLTNTGERKIKNRFPYASAAGPAPSLQLPVLSYTNSIGTANTIYSGTQQVYTDEATHIYPPFASYYRLNQSLNGFNVETRNGRDLSSSTAWIENASNTWTGSSIDDTATEVHFNMQVVTEYWQKKFGRNSFDNKNSDVISFVHLQDPKFAVNAYWGQSTLLPYSSMNYGDGSAANNVGPYVSLDITAHEFGHAIADAADMPHFVYERESGALNEAFSDVWAACIENYGAKNYPGSAVNKKIWQMAEEPHHGDGNRDMINPKRKGMSDTYYGAFYSDASKEACPVPDQDNNDLCAVHQNSSILTKWFSLITIGGRGSNDHNYFYDVQGIDFGKADSIAYFTERLLTPNTDYHAVMNTSINYTSYKYGAASNELTQVIAAWRAVGVLDTLSFDNLNNPVFGTNNSFNCVAVAKNGYVWAGTPGKGLYRYNDLIWEKYTDVLSDSIPVNKVSFRDMKTDRNGGLWIAQSGYGSIGTTSNASGGVYYFDDTTFKSKRYFSSSQIAYKRNVISRNVTSIWVDLSRNNAVAATRGRQLPQVWAVSLSQTNTRVINGETVGLPASGGVAMGLTDVVTLSPGGADYDSNFIKVATPYGINVDNNTSYRGAQTVGGDKDEVWVYSDVNNEKSLDSWGFGANYYNGSPQQLTRYKAATGDSLGVYNASNVSQFGTNFTVKAIYFDKNGNRWLGMSNTLPPFNNAVVVMDNHGHWHTSAAVVEPAGASLALPDIFPLSTLVNNNAITGDADGNVYIGTNNGLVVYSGGATGLVGASPLEDYKSYRRYTVSDGLPSNIVRGLAVDTFRNGVWLATENGVVLWRMKGAQRQIIVSDISSERCGIRKPDLSFKITIKGKYYNKPAINQLITELSDGNGSFSAPTLIETEDWFQPVFENDPSGFSEDKTFHLPANLPDGDNYRIRVRATNPDFIGALSAPISLKKPKIMPSSGALSHTADRECLDAANWTNYFYSNGTPDDESDDILLLSIWKGTSFIGTVGDGSFNVTVASTPGAGSNFGVNVSNAFVNNPFVSMNRYWKVTPTIQPAKTVVVRFYYNSQDLKDVNGSIAYGPIDHTKLVFYKTSANPDPTTNLAGITAPPISFTNDVALDLVKLDKWVYTQISGDQHQAEFAVSGFSGGSGGSTVNNGPLSTLPVQLVVFDAKATNQKVLLSWQTSSELNTAHFEVQRSGNGRDFNMIIGKVLAVGYSNVKTNYSLMDGMPVAGSNYYRLKMVDKDGKFTYSEVRQVDFSGSDSRVSIYPNPSREMLTIKNSLPGKELKISVIDVAGRVMFTRTKANAPLLQIPMSGLSAGFYLLQLDDGSTIVNTRIEKN